jgi:hypothetical protein
MHTDSVVIISHNIKDPLQNLRNTISSLENQLLVTDVLIVVMAGLYGDDEKLKISIATLKLKLKPNTRSRSVFVSFVSKSINEYKSASYGISYLESTFKGTVSFLFSGSTVEDNWLYKVKEFFDNNKNVYVSGGTLINGNNSIQGIFLHCLTARNNLLREFISDKKVTDWKKDNTIVGVNYPSIVYVDSNVFKMYIGTYLEAISIPRLFKFLTKKILIYLKKILNFVFTKLFKGLTHKYRP